MYSVGDRVEFIMDVDGRPTNMEGKISVADESRDGAMSYKITVKKPPEGEVDWIVGPDDIIRKIDVGAIRDDLLYSIGDYVIFWKEGRDIRGHIAQVYPLQREYFVMEEPPSSSTWRIEESAIKRQINTAQVDSGSSEDIAVYEEPDEEHTFSDEIIPTPVSTPVPNTPIPALMPPSTPVPTPVPNTPIPTFKKAESPDKFLRYGFFIALAVVIFASSK